MKELTTLLDDLISCGNKLTETAQALKDYYSAPAPTEEEKPKKPAKKDIPMVLRKLRMLHEIAVNHQRR